MWYPPIIPWLPIQPLLTNEKPVTLYALMQMIAGSDTPTNQLAEKSRSVIFQQKYPLAENWDKAEFETQILNHYMMRRIGFETPTLFYIQLGCRLNEVMPKYNKLFSAMTDFSVLTGKKTERKIEETNNETGTIESESSTSANDDSTATSTSGAHSGSSDTPQGQITDVNNDNYLSQYSHSDANEDRKTTAASNSSGTSKGNDSRDKNRAYTETVTETYENPLKALTSYENDIENIYTMLYKDLDILFYSLV